MTQKLNTPWKKMAALTAALLLLFLTAGVLPSHAAAPAKGTSASAVPTSTYTQQNIVTSEVDNKTGGKNLGHQALMIVGVALIIGVLAGIYGLIHMSESKMRKNEVQMQIRKGRGENDEKDK